MRHILAVQILILWTSTSAQAQTSGQISASTLPLPAGNAHACGTEWYPPAALAAGEQGRTTLSFRIGIDGIPKDIRIVSSSGYADLDSAATKCIATWRYQPATVAGSAVETDWKSSVEWSMPTGKPVNVVITRGRRPVSVPPAQQLIGSQVCPNPMRPPAPLGKISKVLFWVARGREHHAP